ncbi:hypothetical protein [Streptomyces sp. CA2R106]|uniref:hypothetical protein n=1 Tax=Streptomyces sp. CA2R106 TaxID=3120153 RepID=UPI00300ACD9B
MTAYWGRGGPYETWVEFLRRWSAQEEADPGALPPLAEPDFPPDTWARLGLHLGQALDLRLRVWAEQLTGALEAAPDEFSAGRALAQARGGLLAVRALAGHPGLPASLREQLTGMVDGQIRDVQEQLERSLDDAAGQDGADPRGVEERRRTLRDNPLTAAIPAGGAEGGAEGAPPGRPPGAGSGRRRGAKSGSPPGASAAPAPDPWGRLPPDRPRRRVITD